MKHLICTSAIILSTSVLSTAPANAGDSFEEALFGGAPYAKLRYRYERVEQEGFDKESGASTIGAKLGYKTGDFHDFTALVEFETTQRLGGSEYNDTINSRGDHPTVADADNYDLNQAFITYKGVEDTVFNIGRQRMSLDNHRFVGHVGWRQNDQVFDNFNVTNTSIEDVKLFYSYVNRVQRIFGRDSTGRDLHGDVHLFNVSYDGLKKYEFNPGKVTAYGYLLDVDDSLANSSQSYGVSLDGSAKLDEDWKLGWYLEYARQSDYADNPTSYDTNYYHINPSLSYKKLKLFAGHEVLGSDNGVASFRTPLATLHKFNGFADKFLTTPVNGLEDSYIGFKYKVDGYGGDFDFLNGLGFYAAYHNFESEENSTDYGDEIDVKVSKKIFDNTSVLFKFVDYDADAVSSDTNKYVVQLSVDI